MKENQSNARKVNCVEGCKRKYVSKILKRNRRVCHIDAPIYEYYLRIGILRLKIQRVNGRRQKSRDTWWWNEKVKHTVK